VIRSIPVRIASSAAAASSIFSSPIVPFGATLKFRGQGAALQIRWILEGNNRFKRRQQLPEFVTRLPARQDHRRESILNGGYRTDDTHHFVGAEADDGDAKLVGKIAKRVEEALLLGSSADLGEVHFVDCEDADVDFGQRTQHQSEFFPA